MNNEQITNKLDSINQKLNGVIGRLTILRGQSTEGREAHDLALEVGSDLDDLINELL
jgi:hypothetical protein